MLTGHGIEETSKGVCFCKYSTVGLQVVFRDTRVIHPQPQRLVTDELDRPDSLINGSILLFAPTQLVFIDQHGRLLAFLLFLHVLFHCGQNLSIERTIVLFSCLSHLFQQMSRKPDGERLLIIFHSCIVALSCSYVKWLGSLCPSPKKGRPIHPPLERRGLSGLFTVN
jgi:hypothetical protein